MSLLHQMGFKNKQTKPSCQYKATNLLGFGRLVGENHFSEFIWGLMGETGTSRFNFDTIAQEPFEHPSCVPAAKMTRNRGNKIEICGQMNFQELSPPQEAAVSGAQPSSEGDHRSWTVVLLRVLPVHGR